MQSRGKILASSEQYVTTILTKCSEPKFLLRHPSNKQWCTIFFHTLAGARASKRPSRASTSWRVDRESKSSRAVSPFSLSCHVIPSISSQNGRETTKLTMSAFADTPRNASNMAVMAMGFMVENVVGEGEDGSAYSEWSTLPLLSRLWRFSVSDLHKASGQQ